MYSVILSNKAKKAYEMLNDKTYEKLRALFIHLEIHQYPAKEYDLKKLEGMKDCFRVRIGDYRVCYHVSAGEKRVNVFGIERRETAY